MTGFFSTIINLVTLPFKIVGSIFGKYVVAPLSFIKNQMVAEKQYYVFKDKFKAERKRSIKNNDEIW